MIKRFSYFILILLISVCSVFAQDLDEVTISGKVSDTNNAPIVGATVAAKLVATGAERTAITDSEGRFKFIELAPGTYTIKVSMTGFGAQEQTDLVTVSGQNVQLNFTLAPAGVTAEQTVTIGGDDAPIVDTSRTIVGSTITEREVQEIPNNTRNPLDLVLTLGGTSEEALSTRDLASDRGERGISTPG
ncbi:MAG TPA: carboxypeptidase-like regulatory domain-containing protein, partial [Pyrinomonadaceae bacterium]|nr:carboxypeptidase-like regulatory domain-containing protein [Pyrinomonadaceae bacterium]